MNKKIIYGEKEVMINIVTEKAYKDRLSDGIFTILNLNEEDFSRFIKMLTIAPNEQIEEYISFYYSTDDCKHPENEIKIGLNEKNTREYSVRKNERRYLILNFISQLESYIQNLKRDSDEYLRCNEIIATRSMDALKKYFSGRNGEDSELIDKLFEVLTNSDICERFINFDENRDYFRIDGKSYTIEDYLRKVGQIFRYRHEEGDFRGEYLIEHYNLPERIKSSMYQNATQIYQTYHERYSRYIDTRYEFIDVDDGIDIKFFKRGDEPSWNVNEELRTAIFSNMPQDLSLEEQALFIYTKLCQELEYNEEYFYRDKGVSSQFESEFSKERLESIKPGSKIICFDFSRIFSELVNELDGDIEAVVISQGTNGHYLTGFYTDRVSVRLEAINICGKDDATNDLMKAKNGIELRGVQPIFDKDGIINDSLRKVESLIYGRDALHPEEFVKELRSMPPTVVPDNFKLKLQSFIEVMKDRGVFGNEFIQTLAGMCKAKFFGQDGVEKAYLGRRIKYEGEEHIQRYVLIRRKEEPQGEPHFYLINTSSLEVIETTSEQLIGELNSGELIYESEKYKVAGIDKEAG